MSDKQSAAILIGMAAIGFLLWYRARNRDERARLFGLAEVPESSGDKAVATRPVSGVPVLPPVGGIDWSGSNPFQRLTDFAKREGLLITSGFGEKGHVERSLHGSGRAIDVRTRGWSSEAISGIIDRAKQAGIRVLDERVDPGHGKWTGPHLHLEIPRGQ